MQSDAEIQCFTLPGNSMLLDGGAMFGNAPKALWSRWIPADDNNLIPIASRSLLIRNGRYNFLFETGVGAWMPPELKARYGVVENRHRLLESLSEKGLEHTDITHIILSHLHFDHSGGLLAEWNEQDKDLSLLFPNARYITGRKNFERSASPHFRDRASFINGLAALLEGSGRLDLVGEGNFLEIGDIRIEWVESMGHTPGMILSFIHLPAETVFFAGDLAPGQAWVNLPITMGYDRYPERLIEEKQEIFARVYKENARIFYTHDHRYAVSTLEFDNKKKRYIPTNLKEELQIE